MFSPSAISIGDDGNSLSAENLCVIATANLGERTDCSNGSWADDALRNNAREESRKHRRFGMCK